MKKLLSTIVFLQLLSQAHAQTTELRRLTNSPSTALNLHPVLSADARHVIFESTFNPLTNETNNFQTLDLDLSTGQPVTGQIALSRAASSTISASGSRFAFASTDDPLGENPDGNSEIFFYDGQLHQITHSQASSSALRINEGCYHPSLDMSGQHLVFTCNVDITDGTKKTRNFEIYFADLHEPSLKKIVDSINDTDAGEPQISGDGQTLIFIRTSKTIPAKTLNSLVSLNLVNREERIIAQSPTVILPEAKAVSDDGNRVLYLERDEKGDQQIKLFDARWNITRQFISLSPRKDDIQLNPCLSSDGLRAAFASRRRVNRTTSSGGVQVYLYDFPSESLIKVTSAPPEVIADSDVSLNQDGSILAFNFSRLLSEPNTLAEEANNSEIYLVKIPLEPRSVQTLEIFHGATPDVSQSASPLLAPSQITFVRGQHLATKVQSASHIEGGVFPTSLDGTTVMVGDLPAQIIYVSPTQVNFLIPPGTVLGETPITVKSIDNFETRGRAQIVQSASGLFTVSGDGRGTGIFLQEAAATAAMAQNSHFSTRWVAYATGVSGAANVTCQLNGTDIKTESSVTTSAELPGLNQISFEIPYEWRGAGKTTFKIRADGVESNPVDFYVGAAFAGDLQINEVLADPPAGLAGDANHDGLRDSSNDEFIELVNPTKYDLQLTNWTISIRSLGINKEKIVHQFSATQLHQGDAIVVFGGGSFDPLDPVFGGAQIVKASSGNLELSNESGSIILRDATGKLISEFSYGTNQDNFGGNSVNQSITRSPDIDGPFTLHTNSNNQHKRFSPGTKSDGSFFAPRKGILSRVEFTPTKLETITGGTVSINATALDQYGRVLKGIIYSFAVADQTVASLTQVNPADTQAILHGLNAGTTELRIYATDGLRQIQTGPIAVRISPAPPRLLKIEVEPQQIVLNRGGTRLLTTRVFAEDKRPVSDTKFTFHSTNPSVLRIDEDGTIHALAPGRATVTVIANDNYGGVVSGETDVSVRVPLTINEVLADVPPDDPKTLAIEGDANHDGIRNSDDDEFIEFINWSSESVDISGVTINDATSVRFTFPEKTIIPAGGAALIFGGGLPSNTDLNFGGAQIFKAKSLGLKDSGDSLSLKIKVDQDEFIIQKFTYGSGADAPAAPLNQSLVRSKDAGVNFAGGDFTAHTSLPNSAKRPYSPGTRSDGTPFNSPPITRIVVTSEKPSINVGDDVTLIAKAFATVDGQEVEIKGVSYIWEANNGQQSSLTNLTGPNTTLHQAQAEKTQVRARAGEMEGDLELTINQVLRSVELDPMNVSSTVGQSITFTATAHNILGAIVPALAFDFSIRDESSTDVAMVENTTANSITLKLKSAGTFKVVAKFVNVDETKVEGIANVLIQALPPPVIPQPHQLIINEALISYSSSPTQIRTDFIELLNTSDATLDLSGLILSYRPAGSGSVINKITLPGEAGSKTITLPPHEYYLIAGGPESFGVKADFNAASFDLNNTSGAIKIESGQTKLDGLVYQGGSSAPPNAFLGFGDGSVFRFNSGATNDLIRSPNGVVTQDNAQDFRRQGAAAEVTPRAANPTLTP